MEKIKLISKNKWEKRAKSAEHLTNNANGNKSKGHQASYQLTPLLDKKAQIKIQEMAFVLLALVFLFILGFMLFSRLQFSNMEKRVADLREAKALSVLDKIAAMPEMRCSASLGRATETLCIDKDKVIIFSGMSKSYEKIWKGLSSVKILQIYPNEEEFSIYSAGEGNVSYSNFVSLCSEKVNGGNEYTCSLGMILVSIPA